MPSIESQKYGSTNSKKFHINCKSKKELRNMIFNLNKMGSGGSKKIANYMLKILLMLNVAIVREMITNYIQKVLDCNSMMKF